MKTGRIEPFRHLDRQSLGVTRPPQICPRSVNAFQKRAPCRIILWTKSPIPSVKGHSEIGTKGKTGVR